ncbi:uncharacterized protein [Littorina saxatilis]|uniref:uncharacterized protein n=1 Tax=Littorina saxatilis TaxID=31220 RepID=UPI0038B6A131
MHFISGPTRYDILVCIFIPSSKICEHVFEEIENSLPLLEKLYGPLTLEHDECCTYITVIVRPRLAKRKFSLMQFIQDLFSSVSITKYLHGASEAEEIQIVAVHGSSTDVSKASFKDAALKQRHSTLAFHTGEATLRFSDAADEAAVLRDFKSAKGDLKSLFRLYNLKFLHVRQGSIKFRFSFPAQTDSFNSLAAEARIKEFVKHLCSYDSFKELTKRQDVTVEFLCRAKLNTVSVVQAQYLSVQVGNQNNVYISDHQPQALDNDNEDGESLEHDEHSPEKREFLSFNVISISSRNQAIHNEGDRLDQEEENQIGEVDPNSEAIPVLINCEENTAEELFTEWTNSLPLFRRIYPSCQLKRARSGVLWELHPIRHCAYVNVTNFIADLFHTHRLKDIKSRCHLQIDVPVSTTLTSGVVGLSRELHKEKEDIAKTLPALYSIPNLLALTPEQTLLLVEILSSYLSGHYIMAR